MVDNDAEGLLVKVPFRPASEGQYLPLASYELRQAICTTSELDKLHSSPELRDHLALKRRAALRRHRRLQTLRHLGRLLLLVGIIASSGVALYQQPDLPKSALQALKACLPFHHYTGEVTANARQEGTLPHIALPITLLPPSVQASVPSRFSKVNATLHDFTGMTQEAPDTDTLKAPLKATQGEAQGVHEAIQSTAANTEILTLDTPSAVDEKPKKGGAQDWQVFVVGSAMFSLFFALYFGAQMMLTKVSAGMTERHSAEKKIPSINPRLEEPSTAAHSKDPITQPAKQAGRMLRDPPTEKQPAEVIATEAAKDPSISDDFPLMKAEGVAGFEAGSDDFELIPSKLKKSKAGSGDWEEVNTAELSTNSQELSE